MEDHENPAAVWWSLKQSLTDGTVDQWPAHFKLVFKQKVDILNMHSDCQFVFSVLDELYVSHHACCSRCCSKSALQKYEM